MNKRIPLDHLSKGGLIRQLSEVISGAEGEGENEDNSGQDQNQENSEDTSEDNDEDNDQDEDEDNEDDKKPDVTGLKKALAAERAARKLADQKATKLEKAEAARQKAKMSDIEKAQAEAKEATDKATKLAAGLLTRDQNDAIKKFADKYNFIDPTDAIEGLRKVRSKIVFTQDADDPTDIVIDEKSVEKLVKDLATKKPHFIKSGTDDGQETGGQFGGSTRKKPATEDALVGLYPGLSQGS